MSRLPYWLARTHEREQRPTANPWDQENVRASSSAAVTFQVSRLRSKQPAAHGHAPIIRRKSFQVSSSSGENVQICGQCGIYYKTRRRHREG